MKAEQIVVPVAALVIGGVLGGALGYTLKPAPEPVPEEKAPVVAPSAGITEFKVDESASQDDLRRQLRELQRLIARQERRDRESAGKGDETPVAEEPRRERGREDWRERMKREDPERYAAMTNHFVQMQLARRERSQNKIDFFSSLDTSRMSAEDRAQTESLQSLIAKRVELEERIVDESLTDAERFQIGRELWQMQGSINETSGAVREALFKQTAEALGFSGDDVTEISETLGTIIDMTESRGFGPPGPGGRGPGGRGPGGRGPRGGRN